jgi:hypothetical protein
MERRSMAVAFVDSSRNSTVVRRTDGHRPLLQVKNAFVVAVDLRATE